MPRLETDTPLLDIEIRTSHDAQGFELQYLTFKFGAIELQSCPLDAGQMMQLLKGLVAGNTVLPIPIAHMQPLCIPKQLRAGMLTLEKVKPRRSF